MQGFGKLVEMNGAVFQYLQNYCIQCHGPEEEKGDRSFHQLSAKLSGKQVIDLSKETKVHLLQDILELTPSSQFSKRKFIYEIGSRVGEKLNVGE